MLHFLWVFAGSNNCHGVAASRDPGVTSNASVPGFNLSINSARYGKTSMLADEGNNAGVGLARPIASFTPDAVQQFTVRTPAYSAEFGNTGGGILDVTSKSGINSARGIALEYAKSLYEWENVDRRRRSISANKVRLQPVFVQIVRPVVLPKI